MDKKSKVLLLIIVILILISVGVTYYNIFILRNYQITMEVSCDPATESCFSYIDEESGEVSYYKILNKTASQFPTCNTEDPDCGEPSCYEGEQNCSYTYCDPENLSEGEVCAESVDSPSIESVK